MENKEKKLAIAVVDLFDDLLEEKNLEIPCADSTEEEDRRENENAAKIYG